MTGFPEGSIIEDVEEPPLSLESQCNISFHDNMG